jgi:transcriptional regulator with GAF, ATPase, and Fis domain
VSHKDGLWRVAGRGTVFLDEIGDLRLDHQAKILRVLQEGTMRPVGGKEEIRVHARVIAATNRDLFALVRAGEFRTDLYYRLRSFLIRTPSLRDHPEDVPALAAHFWTDVTGDPSAVLPPPALDELGRRGWPGNARELRAVLAQMRSLFPEEPATWEHLQVVFCLQGYAIKGATSRPVERSVERLRTREPLLRLQDAVSATRATLEPLRRRGWAKEEGLDRVHDALQRRIDELGLLLAEEGSGRDDPPLTEGNVEAVRRLRRRLIDVTVALEVDPAAAHRLSRRAIKGEVHEVLAMLERELRAVGRSSSA